MMTSGVSGIFSVTTRSQWYCRNGS